jgi:hypothetical protein
MVLTDREDIHGTETNAIAAAPYENTQEFRGR